MNKIVRVVLVALGLVGGWLSVLFGGWDNAMVVLTTFIVLDFVSGWARAFIQKQLSSDESLRGVVRKAFLFLVVAVAAQVDRFTGSVLVRNAVITFYCASEALSILENSVAAGLPVPEFLREALKQLSEKKFEA